MSPEDQHPREALQALLDGVLPPAERTTVELHLASCDECRAELEAVRWSKRQLGPLAQISAPAGLVERIQAALDAEDARGARRSRPFLWLPLAAAAVLLLALLAVPLWQAERQDVADEVRTDLAEVSSGTLPLEARSLAPAELEAWFAEQGLPFPARVFDLTGMAFELAGGRMQRTGGGPSALYAYRGPGKSLVVCQMFAGVMPAVESSTDVHFRDDGMEFRTVRRDGAVLVFWQEGPVVCVLASTEVPDDQLRALAYAKAIRA